MILPRDLPYHNMGKFLVLTLYFQHAFQEQNIYIKLQKTYISTSAMNAKNTLIQVMPLLLKMFLHTLFIQLVYIIVVIVIATTTIMLAIWNMVVIDVKRSSVMIEESPKDMMARVNSMKVKGKTKVVMTWHE